MLVSLPGSFLNNQTHDSPDEDGGQASCLCPAGIGEVAEFTVLRRQVAM